MTQPSAEPVAQLQRAWHRLMHTLGRTHPDQVNAGRIYLKVLQDRMKGR